MILPTEEKVLAGINKVVSMLGLTVYNPDIRNALPVMIMAYVQGFIDGKNGSAAKSASENNFQL